MSVTVSQHKNFVGGKWVDAVEGGTMEVLNPATGETIAEVPQGTQADVDRAVAAAKKALPSSETAPMMGEGKCACACRSPARLVQKSQCDSLKRRSGPE